MILNNYIYQATSIWPSPHSWNDQGCVSQKHCELPACIFCIMSPLVNTPDSDNLLVRSELCTWTVYWLTWSLHSVPFSLLPEQGKSVDVYFTSDHSLMDFCCATSSHMDECDIIHLCKYIQFKFTSHTLRLWMEHIRSLRTGIMAEYPVMFTS